MNTLGRLEEDLERYRPHLEMLDGEVAGFRRTLKASGDISRGSSASADPRWTSPGAIFDPLRYAEGHRRNVRGGKSATPFGVEAVRIGNPGPFALRLDPRLISETPSASEDFELPSSPMLTIQIAQLLNASTRDQHERSD